MAYERINWQNEPSEATALNDVNLNKMDSAIYELDGKATTTETAITNLQDGKVDKVNGKGLSQVDNVTVTQHVAYGTVVSTIKTYGQDGTEVTSQVCNGIVVDSSLSNSSTNPVQNKVVKSAIDEKSTVSISDTLATGTTLANITIDGTTTAIKGSDIEVDDEMSPTSPNPVQNKVIYTALNDLLPEETAEGNPISITDASGLSAKSCEVTFSPIQSGSGDPSPENVRPISGRDSLVLGVSGYNLWDEEWEHKKGYSTGQMLNSDSNLASKNFIKVFPSASYYLVIPSIFDGFLYQYDSEQNFILAQRLRTGGLFSAGANTHYIKFASNNDAFTDGYGNNISINYPSTVTAYNAYKGQTHTATFPDTVYGCKVVWKDGVVKAIIDKASVLLKDLSWTRPTSGSFYADISDKKQGIVGFLTENLTPTLNSVSTTSIMLLPFGTIGQNVANARIYINYGEETTMEDFISAMGNYKVIYELATPTEIALTAEQIALLKGNNTLFTDGDNITLKYSADIKQWVLAQLPS